MANETIYTLVYATVNGALLTEESSIDVRRMTNAQVQKTVAKGFAGVSPGSPMAEISFKNAIPKADFELDPGPFMLSLVPIEVGIQCAGKIAVVKGFILEDGISHAVDNPATLDFKVTCGFPVFT